MLKQKRKLKIDKEKLIRLENDKSITDFYSFNEEDKLGEGGYGVVLKATHKKSGIVRAIKIVKK